jgi:hypothetical protein
MADEDIECAKPNKKYLRLNCTRSCKKDKEELDCENYKAKEKKSS